MIIPRVFAVLFIRAAEPLLSASNIIELHTCWPFALVTFVEVKGDRGGGTGLDVFIVSRSRRGTSFIIIIPPTSDMMKIFVCEDAAGE